jgi:16S rRNA (cytosine967-C5)-methyltransferase
MNARDFALAQLDRVALPGWQARIIKQKPQPPADPRDLALAEQIRVGVIKNHLLLEHLLEHYAKQGSRIDPLVRKIISIGLFQIRFLTRVPPSAAADEAVEQARRFGRRHAAGFVNAILRRATRERDVPLPDRSADPTRFAETALSHPPELVARLIEMLGVEDAVRFCEHDNAEPPTIVRAFRNTTFPPADIGDLTITPHQQRGMFVVEGARRATFAGWAEQGVAQVQDPTAALVVDRLQLGPGMDALDRCAGLGTKTLQMHDAMNGEGWIMAVDPSEVRIEGLRRLLKARKIENIALLQVPMLRKVPEIRRPAFDRILIDVPCSNSGVMARRPEARYTQTPEALASLSKLQDEIVDDTADYLRPGGIFIYSTCSIWPEENEQRVTRFLKSRRDFEQIDNHFTLPSLSDDPTAYRDGGYYAVLRRRQ